ncbi:type IV pilin protein [Dyella silvatica]|uniref:type IV pilin protein n=1 Tax=Dyella silvatica TaxID=2992128 RepID=UPI0022579D2F|nr:type IV pilin protein [Dyella silvatica]
MRAKQHYPSAAGFSLIELLIVVMIIAVLTAIAFPSYTKYLQRSRRSDAYAALSQDQAILERCFAQSFDYNNVSGTGSKGCLPLLTTSPSNYYTIALSFTGTTTPHTDYTLSATPATGSPQLKDTQCAKLTLTSGNVRTAADSGGTDQTKTCWQQ